MPSASSNANDNAPMAEALRARGLGLARVSGRDVTANQHILSGYRQYIKDHPEDARQYGIRQPHELTEGQLVLVAVENHQPAVYLLNEVLTASERQRLTQHVATLDLSDLPDIPTAAHELSIAGEHASRAKPPRIGASVAETGLTVSALARRWHYSRQGVQKLARRSDFPPPCFIFRGGQVRIWAIEDIEKYERNRPELHSAAAKMLKVRRFAWARRQRRRGQSAG